MEVQPALIVRGPVDLVCAVPYLLGFHPEASLVVVGLEGGLVVVTIRVDLAALAEAAPLDHAVAAMRRGGATDFVGIVFHGEAIGCSEGVRAGQLPWAGLASELVAAVEAVDGVVGDVLLVAGGRCWSYLCRARGCCPPEGAEIPDGGSEIAASATYAGLVALPGRDSVGQLLDPLPDRDRAELRAEIDEALCAVATVVGTPILTRWDRSDVRALFAAARAAEREPATIACDPAELARFAVALRRIPVRDAIWMALDDGRLQGDGLWRYLARALPAPFDAAPLFLVGWAAWRDGRGALARIAVDRALVSDPAYGAADLLLTALDDALDPRALPKLRRGGRRCDR